MYTKNIVNTFGQITAQFYNNPIPITKICLLFSEFELKLRNLTLHPTENGLEKHCLPSDRGSSSHSSFIS